METSGALWLSLSRVLAMGLYAALVSTSALATEAERALEAGLQQQVRQLALAGTQAAAPGVIRVDVQVGRLDARLRLAPCQRVEPYLPAGTRLWGKSRIGLRCAQGPTPWNVYLPITVKVYGSALVATAPLRPGAVVTEADVIQAEVDLAEDASVAMTDAKLAIGRTLARAVSPGQSLRQAHLKARQWFAVGETVQVLALGAGFSVAGVGQALTPGTEGQPARVRTESGRVLTGVAVGAGRMEMAL